MIFDTDTNNKTVSDAITVDREHYQIENVLIKTTLRYRPDFRREPRRGPCGCFWRGAPPVERDSSVWIGPG